MYTKIVQSGDLVEVYTYQHEPVRQRRVHKEPKQKSLFARRPRRSNNLNQAKLAFRRRVRANLQKGVPALLTLTMRDICAYEDSVASFTAFGRAFRRNFGQDIGWIAVAEFQRRGALHFHALVWGLTHDEINSERTTRRIANLWGKGFADIVPTDGSPKLATYLAKYMFKAMSDIRLAGKKAYFTSRNVLRPVSITAPSAVDAMVEATGLGDIQPLQDRSYDTLWLGRANYKSYSLNQHGNKTGIES